MELLPTDHLVHPIWMQKTCTSHEHDGTHFCFSCNRMEGYPPRDQVVALCITKKETIQTKFKQWKITIFILKGLPRIPTGSFLAHEMMHAWLRLNGYGKLNPHVEEGICDVMSYMWLDFEIMSVSGSNVASSSSSISSTLNLKSQRSQFQRKLAQVCKRKLENREVPIYGEGFHAGYAAVRKYGLKSVLDHIKMKGGFPC
ncbi:Protein DA1-related 2 [Platanthera guangdongensis]|uniref:Protein DA1-related 2 n=1 Tax=Platanthera guangdongensis TaxID=2320717 RepID=A0ABR2MX24_9ASPA